MIGSHAFPSSDLISPLKIQRFDTFTPLTNTKGEKKRNSRSDRLRPPPPFNPPLCLTSVIARSFAVLAWGVDRRRCLSVSALSSPSLLCSPRQTESLVMFSLQTSPHPHSALASVGERRDDSLIASHQRHTHPFIKWR